MAANNFSHNQIYHPPHHQHQQQPQQQQYGFTCSVFCGTKAYGAQSTYVKPPRVLTPQQMQLRPPRKSISTPTSAFSSSYTGRRVSLAEMPAVQRWELGGQPIDPKQAQENRSTQYHELPASQPPPSSRVLRNA